MALTVVLNLFIVGPHANQSLLQAFKDEEETKQRNIHFSIAIIYAERQL